ncbi:MAG TPA: hypothetical protein VMS30_02590 [Phycisphaerales bacterium]|nr:hypothetical protein [Phycisphaerales bacterium]
MLRRLKRLREHIRYHSAPRPGNAWSRAMDFAFIASFLLSFPAAFLSDLAVRENRSAINLTGILARTPGGATDAWVMAGTNQSGGATASTASGTSGRGAPERDDTIIGNFTLDVADTRRGWPLVTSIDRSPGRLTIDLVAEPVARTNVQRDGNDPIQRGIEKYLIEDDQAEALDAWNLDGVRTRRQWWAWFPAIGAWWLMMFAIAGITIQTLRFASLWMHGKRMQRQAIRRAEGKCIACGYDMTGLEFNEKCPECGAHVW